MKQLLAFVAILALSSSPSFGNTLDFPNEGDVMFKITIPDNWEPDQDDDEVVEATSPEGFIQLSIWELETEEEVKNLVKDIEEILKDHAKEIKLVGQPQKANPGGLDGILFSGTAVDEDDEHPIEFYALLIGSQDKAAVVYIEADANAPKKETDKLNKILKSIVPPGGTQVLRASLALDNKSKPGSTFAPDAPKIYAFFAGNELKDGDKITGVWMIDDVGDAAPKNTKIGSADVTATSATCEGNFTLTKSENDWPVGNYHVEILVNDKLVATLKYKIVDE